jgi:HSP20 family protein
MLYIACCQDIKIIFEFLFSMHGTAVLLLKYYTSVNHHIMTASEKSNIRRTEEVRSFVPISRHLDNVFEDFRREMESMFHTWTYSMTGLPFPVLADIDREIRLPLYDMADKGDKYELQLEIPGIDKNKIDVKATKNSIEISGEQSEKTEEKKKN